MEDYNALIQNQLEEIKNALRERGTSPEDLVRVEKAFAFAQEAHEGQRRKSGAPYIIHPVAVARIVALELQLGPNSVIAAFLHDVVEDTPHTSEEIKALFGNDVAYLVRVVTKQKK